MEKSRCSRTVLVISFMVIFSLASPAPGTGGIDLRTGDVSPDYRPGKTNPVANPARRLLLAQKQLGASMLYPGKIATNINGPTHDLLMDWTFLNSYPYLVPAYNITDGPVATTAGRVLTPLKDSPFAVFYTRDGNKTMPAVCFIENGVYMRIPGTFYDDNLPSGTYGTIDIACGDIDNAADENGEYHDEIVIAYRKKNAGSGFSTWITALKPYYTPPGTYWFKVLDSVQTDDPVVDSGNSFLSLTMGDYNNDGKDEIAVGYQMRYPYPPPLQCSFHLLTFDYDATTGKLVQKGKHIDPNRAFNLVDLASGDFDGDGPDDIAALYAVGGTGETDLVASININTYRINKEDLGITLAYNYYDTSTWEISNQGGAIASGFFRYDPENGYTTARRQLAIALIAQKNKDGWRPWVFSYDVDENLKLTRLGGMWGRSHNYPDGWLSTALKPEIVAARFRSLGYKSILGLPVMTDQIVASWAHSDDHESWSRLIFNSFNVDNLLNIWPVSAATGYCFYPGICPDSQTSFIPVSAPIVASCEYENESYYLGAPVHITVPKIISSVRIIQEPPKHLDYLPDSACKPHEPCEWEIVNVSKRDDFYASFEESTTKSIETTSTSQTNKDIGGSEKVTAKETFETGVPDIDESKVTMTESESVSYDYESVTKKLNGNYTSVTCGEEFDTSADDALQLKGMLMDIWRYPVYGLKTQEGKNAFYEVVMPGNEVYMTVAGTAMSDYYQPIQENGNLLSYPQITDPKFPYDLGSFQVEGISYTDVMTLSTDLSYGGIEETYYVSWADKKWEEKTTSQKKTLSESADFKMGFKGTASALLAGGSWSVKVDVSFHNQNSWSKTSYSESETETDGRVTIQVPAADADYDYSFEPMLYTTVDGTLKLAHTAAPAPTASFWQEHYHGQPDLSLNLPMKFWWRQSNNPQKLGYWYMNAYRQERSRMRGIFLSSNNPETNKGKEHYLAGSATAGDTIYVQTYVYNYSLGKETGPFIVRFSYAPYDVDLNDGIPDLTTIGDVEVSNLLAQERKEVSVKWEIAKDLGGNERGAGKPYVIYVTLDPDNEVTNEIHELYVEDQSPTPKAPCPIDTDEYSKECGIFCGSNNQGYWPWDNSFMIFCPSKEAEGETVVPLELRFKPESLEVVHRPQSKTYGDRLFTHMEYLIRVVIEANRADKDYREVLFYDDDKVFSMKRSFGLNPGENDFYCRWIPKEKGERTLKMVIMEDEDDPEPGNNTITLDVEVLDLQIPVHR